MAEIGWVESGFPAQADEARRSLGGVAGPPSFHPEESAVPMHKRGFHVHVFQTAGDPRVRWEVTRTYWSTGMTTRSAALARGALELDVEGGTPLGVAESLLRAVLAELGRAAATD